MDDSGGKGTIFRRIYIAKKNEIGSSNDDFVNNIYCG